jgi:hypothetical protein
MKKKTKLELPTLTDSEWNDLGTRMLSLHLMDAVKQCFPQPFNKKDLAEVIGKRPSYVHQLCVGDKLLTMKILQTIQRVKKVNFDLVVRQRKT